MAIVRWDPFRDFLSLQNEVGRVFERTFGAEGVKGTKGATWTPAIDAYETDTDIVVKAEVPEVDVNDIDITLTEDSLNLKGERKFTEEIEEDSYYRLERRYGTFQRSIPIPGEIKKDEVSADYKDGILVITIPKAEESKPKQVKVKVDREKE